MDLIKMSANNIFQVFRNFNYNNLQKNSYFLGSFKIKEDYYEDIKISLGNGQKNLAQLFFTKMEQIILLICFDYYIKNFNELDENGYLEIKISTIHEKYRFMCKKITDKALNSYLQAFENLASKTIEISFDKYLSKKTYLEKLNIYEINQAIIEYTEIKNKDKVIGFKYSFGKLGLLLKSSKQIFSIPANFLAVKETAIDGLNLAITLGYLIFINKKNKEFNCSFLKILKRIPFYYTNKKQSSTNYFYELKRKNDKFYKELKHIISLTDRVLKNYKEKKIIVDYYIPKITAKNFDDFDLKIKVKIEN